jgi:hypothetical protein
MQKSTQALLNEIEDYCQSAGIAESTFGRHAINDGKLCARLRGGKNVTLATAERVKEYIQEHPANGDAGERPAPAQEPSTAAAAAAGTASSTRPFRFYDNRQKYLAFVNTCNEKWVVAERASREFAHVRPIPPAVRLFDAGMGDGTVLSNVMRAMHQKFPTMPFYVVGKEISLEDISMSPRPRP